MAQPDPQLGLKSEVPKEQLRPFWGARMAPPRSRPWVRRVRLAKKTGACGTFRTQRESWASCLRSFLERHGATLEGELVTEGARDPDKTRSLREAKRKTALRLALAAFCGQRSLSPQKPRKVRASANPIKLAQYVWRYPKDTSASSPARLGLLGLGFAVASRPR